MNTPTPKYITEFKERIMKPDPENPNGVIFGDGTKVDFNPFPNPLEDNKEV